LSYQCGAVDRGVNGMVSLTIHGDASLEVHFYSTGIQYGSRAWSYKLENPRWSGRTPLLCGLGLLRSLLATSVTQMGGGAGGLRACRPIYSTRSGSVGDSGWLQHSCSRSLLLMAMHYIYEGVVVTP
jgi:hypothetical protein